MTRKTERYQRQCVKMMRLFLISHYPNIQFKLKGLDYPYLTGIQVYYIDGVPIQRISADLEPFRRSYWDKPYVSSPKLFTNNFFKTHASLLEIISVKYISIYRGFSKDKIEKIFDAIKYDLKFKGLDDVLPIAAPFVTPRRFLDYIFTMIDFEQPEEYIIKFIKELWNPICR